MNPVTIGGACPHPQMLSAYLDGKLDPSERGRVEDHISRCEDCYFVVRETALVMGDSDAGSSAPPLAGAPDFGMVVQGAFGSDSPKAEAGPAAGSPGDVSGPTAATTTATEAAAAPARASGHPRRTSFVRYLMPLAATLIVGAGALALWRQVNPANAYAEAVRPLVDAVGDRRFVEPRLVGGFRFGPLISSNRGPSARDLDQWRVLASSAEIKEKADQAPTPENQRALAAAELVLGETEQAVTMLEQLARDQPQAAAVHSDLAAAYSVRALRDGRADDWPRALEAAEVALELEPGLHEALFNRAYALEEMSLWNEALRGWQDYLAANAGPRDGWTELARSRIEELRNRPSSDLELKKRDIGSALNSLDQDGLNEAVTSAPAAAMEVFEALLVDDAVDDHEWARRVSALQRGLRASPARVAFPAGAVEIRHRPELRAYGVARQKYRQLEWQAARDQLSDVVRRRSSALGSLPAWGALYLAAIDFQAGKDAEPDATLRGLERESVEGPLFLGRVAWVRGMIALRSGRYDSAALNYAKAAAFFTEANDPGSGSAMAVAAGEVFDQLGLASQSWGQVLRGLEGRGEGQRLRSSALLLRTAELALSGGQSRAALAFAREAASVLQDGDPIADRVVVERTLARILARGDPEEATRRFASARSLAGSEPDSILKAQLSHELDHLDAERQFAEGAPEFETTASRLLDELSRQGARGRQPGLTALRGVWRMSRGDLARGEEDLAAAVQIFETNPAPGGVSRAAYHRAAWRAYEGLISAHASRGDHIGALALVERSLRFLRGSSDQREVSEGSLQSALHGLQGNRATLVLVPTEGRLHAWVLKRGSLNYVSADLPSSVLEKEVDDFVRVIEHGDARVSGSQLFEQLVLPSLSSLSGTPVVEVVPHRFLSRVPFHALWDSRGGRYWGEAASIFVGSSVRPQSRTGGELRSGISILAVNAGAGTAPLPRASAEARTIALLYPDAKLFLGNDVTSASLTQALQSSAVVHFAGHAQSNESFPDLASLLVTDGNGGVQPFLARTVSGLRLAGLSLVVLASCGSIRSSSTLDHGMMSVAGHFLNAGANGVLGALWDVDDDDARVFMVRFHRSFAASRDPITALAAARSDAIKAGEDPSRWAAFALVMD